MNVKLGSSLLAAMLAFSAGACQGGFAGQTYAPIIDIHGSSGKDPNTYPVDLAECQRLAAQTSQLADAAKGGGVGALLGAGTGAIGGAIKGGGNVAEGAGLGALAGLVLGGTYSAFESNKARQGTVMQCMANRGWTVVGR